MCKHTKLRIFCRKDKNRTTLISAIKHSRSTTRKQSENQPRNHPRKEGSTELETIFPSVNVDNFGNGHKKARFSGRRQVSLSDGQI